MNTSSPAATSDIQPLLTSDQLIDQIVACDDRWERARLSLVLRMRMAIDEFKTATNARQEMLDAAFSRKRA